MKQERITSEEQVTRWVDGESVHRIVDGLKGGECCPDFSCCKPHLLADVEIRKAFAASNRKGREKFLGTFLDALLSSEFPDKKIHVTGITKDQA